MLLVVEASGAPGWDRTNNPCYVNQYAPAHVLKEKHEAMLEARTYFQERVHKPLAELENAFRDILDPNSRS